MQKLKKLRVSVVALLIAFYFLPIDVNAQTLNAAVQTKNFNMGLNDNAASKFSYNNLLVPQKKSETSENAKGLYASLFFGTSQLNYNFDNSNNIMLSQITQLKGFDSIIPIPNGVSATLDPSSTSQKLNLDAGLWLGYFPKFLNFELADEKTLSIGVMSKLGLSFNGGLGAWLGAGPEVMYSHDKLTFNFGYLFGWTGTQRALGNLQLTGSDRIIVETGFEPPTDEKFESESGFYRLHNEDSKLMVIASSRINSVYGRIGYTFSERTGVGLIIGYRNMQTLKTSYELWGPHKKLGNTERSPLNGPEMSNLSSSFGFDGFFIQIQLYEKPLW